MAKAGTTTPKFPMIDTDLLISTHKRNLDAFTSAGQILADGVKAYTQRQTEILQAAITEMVQRSEGMLKGGAPTLKPVGEQVSEAKTAYEKVVANAEELANIAFKAQSEAMSVLGDCALANIESMKRVAA